jgi:hypothetical protein
MPGVGQDNYSAGARSAQRQVVKSADGESVDPAGDDHAVGGIAIAQGDERHGDTACKQCSGLPDTGPVREPYLRELCSRCTVSAIAGFCAEGQWSTRWRGLLLECGFRKGRRHAEASLPGALEYQEKGLSGPLRMNGGTAIPGQVAWNLYG